MLKYLDFIGAHSPRVLIVNQSFTKMDFDIFFFKCFEISIFSILLKLNIMYIFNNINSYSL